MTLEDLGYYHALDNYLKEHDLAAFTIGRVIAEHKERYTVKTVDKEYDGEIIGNLRFTAVTRADFPATGDWVVVSPYNHNQALIHAILPRKTVIARQAVGTYGEKQIIATNIDYAFIVQAVDRDFNINRIERYLTLCYATNVSPVIILNKIDLIGETELKDLVSKIRERIKQVPVFTISNENLRGIDTVKECIKKGKTYCLLGSSGVGKSTLLNTLSGEQFMRTDTISTSTNKGRHVTSHRELLILENGGILIDNPGMREVGLTDSDIGFATTFDAIKNVSKNCKFRDCTHTTEKGCAVIAALQNSEIDKSSYLNYLKMEKEKEHFESTLAQKRKKDKDFGKMIRNYKKNHLK